MANELYSAKLKARLKREKETYPVDVKWDYSCDISVKFIKEEEDVLKNLLHETSTNSVDIEGVTQYSPTSFEVTFYDRNKMLEFEQKCMNMQDKLSNFKQCRALVPNNISVRFRGIHVKLSKEYFNAMLENRFKLKPIYSYHLKSNGFSTNARIAVFPAHVIKPNSFKSFVTIGGKSVWITYKNQIQTCKYCEEAGHVMVNCEEYNKDLRETQQQGSRDNEEGPSQQLEVSNDNNEGGVNLNPVEWPSIAVSPVPPSTATGHSPLQTRGQQRNVQFSTPIQKDNHNKQPDAETRTHRSSIHVNFSNASDDFVDAETDANTVLNNQEEKKKEEDGRRVTEEEQKKEENGRRVTEEEQKKEDQSVIPEEPNQTIMESGLNDTEDATSGEANGKRPRETLSSDSLSASCKQTKLSSLTQ